MTDTTPSGSKWVMKRLIGSPVFQVVKSTRGWVTYKDVTKLEKRGTERDRPSFELEFEPYDDSTG